MPKLEIELKQHTPIIQFQGEQCNAVLRGTELKPKLDKFLIQKVFKNNFEKYRKYLLGYSADKNEEDYGDKKSFNYKVKFKMVKNFRNESIEQKYPFYFNNIGNAAKDDTHSFVNCETIKIEFFSLHKDLIDYIKVWFKKFLLINNFGFRQNKGFGSFTTLDNIDVVDEIKKLKPNNKIYYIEYGEKIDSKEIMKDASIIYQIMKSGINYPNKPDLYIKSYLFEYMKAKKIGNEKRFIKEKFFGIEPDPDDTKVRYVRSVLGVSDYNDFRKAPNNKKGAKINYVSEVKRYKSPILFKIIDNNTTLQ